MQENETRIFYGIVDSEVNRADSDTGRINVILEERDGEFFGVDPENPFCPTGQVFVTKEFSQLVQRYGNTPTLLRIESIRTKNEVLNERDCLYITNGLAGNRISKADPKLVPNQIIESDYDEEDLNISIPKKEPLLSPQFIMHDSNRAIFCGPWFVNPTQFVSPLEQAMMGEGVEPDYLTIEPALGVFKGDPYNAVRMISADIITQDDIIVSRFMHHGMNEKYGTIRFLRSVDILRAASEVKVHPTTYFLSTLVKDYLEKKRTPLAQTKKQWTLLAGIIKSHASDFRVLKEHGLNTLVEKLESTQEAIDVIDAQFEEFMRSPAGSEMAKSYIENNFESLLDKKKRTAIKDALKSLDSETQERQKDLERLNKLIQEAKAERGNIEDEVASLQKQLEKLNDADAQTEEMERRFLEAQREKEKERDALIAEIKTLQENRASLEAEIKEYEDFKSLKEARIRLDNYIEERNRVKDAVEAQLQDLDNKLSERTDRLLERINEVTPHVYAVLRGRKSLNNKTESDSFTLPANIRTAYPEVYASADNAALDFAVDLTAYLTEKFSQKGRDYSPIFVANLLISIQNNFLNFIYGQPGTGKTSAVRLMKDFLNLGSFFLEVNVAKGWDSERDWIGFYNTLQQEFVPSRTGVYRYLKSVEGVDGEKPLSWILLDEANLSTMEHYWAQFNGMADKESDLMLRLDGNNEISISEDLRFIGTINNDHTTRPLSERMVSRATVINMELDSTTAYQIDVEQPTEEMVEWFESGAISSELINSAFRAEAIEMPAEVDMFVKGFLAEMNDDNDIDVSSQGFRLSNRTIGKVADYANVAYPLFNKLISRSSQDLRSEAVVADYAISQLVIPAIRLNGESAKTRLEKARDYCSSKGLRLSHDLLRNILLSGEENLDQFGMFNS